MSPDTADPDRPADPGHPAADRPAGGSEDSPRPASDADSPAGGSEGSPRPATDADRPAGGDGSPGRAPDADRPAGFAPLDPDREVSGWPAGVPVAAGTPVTAPGADPLGWYQPAPGFPAAAAERPVGARRRAVGVTLGAAFLLTVLGAPLGLLWAAIAPDTPLLKTAEGANYAQPAPEQPIAADGWFSLLGLGFGVLAAIALWFLLRRRRGPVGLVAGVLGGLGAAVVAWQVGRRIGLSTYQHLLASAQDGQAFTKPADLRAGGLEWHVVPYGNLLLPAFGAAVAYTLLAGWSRWPALRPEPDLQGTWPPAGPAADAGFSSGPEDRPAR